MVSNGSDYTEKKLQQLRTEARQIHTRSNFKFLQEHRGLRPKELHVLMGTAGSGKSTVIRAIIADMLKINSGTVYAWLSEETRDSFMLGLVDNDMGPDGKNRIKIDSELDREKNGDKKTIDSILEKVEFISPEVLIIDNITTSPSYRGKSPDEQGEVINKLKEFANKNDIPILLIAHTRKDVSDNMSRLITENDIRGCADITNLAEFFYVLQRFEVGERYFQTIRIQKHRSQPIKNKLFHLEYSPEIKTYTGDRPIDFDSFKEIFKQRNQL